MTTFIARLLLAFNAFAFAVIGLLFLLWPTQMAAMTGLAAVHPAGLIDIRATYGGSQLGFAGLLAFCAVSIGGSAIGLLAACCVLAGFACGRLVGILAAGHLDTLSISLLAIEVTMVLANLWMLRRLQRHSRA